MLRSQNDFVVDRIVSDLYLLDFVDIDQVVVDNAHEHDAIIELLKSRKLMEVYFGDDGGQIVDQYEDIDVEVAHLVFVLAFQMVQHLL